MSVSPVISKSLPPRLAQLVEEWTGRASVLTAPAKINVRLKVEGRRPDGYHLLSMINCATSLTDTLVFTILQEDTALIQVDPPMDIPTAVGENLVTKAFQAFWREFELSDSRPGFSCVITKRIPIGGGLGGGSADAGAVIRHLVSIFGDALREYLSLPEGQFAARINRVALSCGADVPYSCVGGLCWVGGIGEQVDRIRSSELAPHRVLLSVPPVAVSTQAFYDRFRSDHPSVAQSLDQRGRSFARNPDSVSIVDLVENDFEETVIRLEPLIGKGLTLAREAFPRGTALTGSGSVFFSLVGDAQEGNAEDLSVRLSSLGIRTYLASLNFL